MPVHQRFQKTAREFIESSPAVSAFIYLLTSFINDDNVIIVDNNVGSVLYEI